MRKILIEIVIVSIIISACSILEPSASEVVPVESATPTVAPLSTTESVLPPTEPLNLTIWLPEEFNPDDNNEAGQLLQARLDEFTEHHPGVRIEVRIKALEGTGGLLDSLTSAHSAAPLALPDLIALPLYDYQTAAAKGLLISVEELLIEDDRSDVYDFANQMTSIQDVHYGISLAIDTLVLAYHPSNVGDPPRDWTSVLEIEDILGFAAADRQAYASLAFYHSSGGQLLDDQDRPTLETDKLLEFLTFLDASRQSGVTPYWLTQYDTEERGWQAFILNQTNLVVTWMHNYLTTTQEDIAVSQIPTSNGNPYTLADGWILAIATPQSERHALATELAIFLTESTFLGEWTAAAGYFPPRSNALESWSSPTDRALANQLLPIAEIVPEKGVLNILGPILEQVTVEVLKNQLTPEEAVNIALDLLTTP